MLRPNYRTKRIWYAHLTGQEVPEAVITSVSPPTGQLEFHSGNLQVLSWDPLAKRWIVLFDAQKTTPPQFGFTLGTSNAGPGENELVTGADKPPPVLDPSADVTFGPVRFARLLSGGAAQMIFSSFANYGGSGYPGNLVVVDFKGGMASLAYYWSGDGGVKYHLRRNHGRPVIEATAEYWTAADAHCCPVRRYRFTVGRSSNRYIGPLSDERPWLGVSVRAQTLDSRSPLSVVDVVPGSPAARSFRKGDVILQLVTPSIPVRPGLIGPALLDQLARLNAGTTASIRIRRGGLMRMIRVRFGSLIDESVGSAPSSSDYEISTL